MLAISSTDNGMLGHRVSRAAGLYPAALRKIQLKNWINTVIELSTFLLYDKRGLGGLSPLKDTL